MNETAKAVARRVNDHAFHFYLAGSGIDIGCGRCPLSLYRHLFPTMGTVRPWDVEDGDAQTMVGIPKGAYTWAHSSHCLEHLRDPFAALRRWLEIVTDYVIVTVPDWRLYEHRQWPSQYNGDHKWAFTLESPPAEHVIDVLELVQSVRDIASPVRIVSLESTFNRGIEFTGADQTLGPIAECAIEIVLSKR